MSVLSQKQRDKLPASTFAGPHRSFPINDANHAKAALIDVGRAHDLTDEERARIRARARAALAGVK